MQKKQILGDNFRRFPALAILLLAALIIQVKSASADTHYVCGGTAECAAQPGWGTGNNVGDCTDQSNPCATIYYGVDQMSGGDTLVIGDGTYTGDDNMMDTYDNGSPPEGSIDAYTIVKAENIGGVIIDGEYQRRPLLIRGDETGIDGKTGDSPSHDYIEINGIDFRHATYAAISVHYVHHIRLLNVFASDGERGPIVITCASNILIENSAFWGDGRYTLFTSAVRDMVIRNCVVRHDRSDSAMPMGGISNYGNANVEIQNSIVLDSDQSEYFLNYSQCQGAFANPGTSSRTDSGPINIVNSISLNNHLRFGTSDWGQYRNNVTHTNCIGWDITAPESSPGSGSSTSTYGSRGDSTFNNCTFGEIDTFNNDEISSHFWGYNGDGLGGNTNTAQNNIYHNLLNGDLLLEWETSNNHVVHGLSSSYEIDSSAGDSGTSTNIHTYNPSTNGLQYLPRIESTSNLENDGIGANIIKMYGKLGTMWGEAGYNLLQDGTNGQDDIDLWPFPNEDLIKKKMQAYSYDGGNLTGDRGFASSTAQQIRGGAVTLTSYIWEYLGNEMPCEIYSTCGGDTTAPSIPQNLNATTFSTSQIDLSWDASTDDTEVTGYNIYRDGSFLDNTPNTNYSSTGLTANTAYVYTVQAYDSANNSSAQSTVATATTMSIPGVIGRGMKMWKAESQVDPYHDWGTNQVVGSATKEQEVVQDFVYNNIKRLYASYNKTESEIAAWNQRLHNASIESYLTIGDSSYDTGILPGQNGIILDAIDTQLLNFNNGPGRTPGQQFDGIRLNLEPQRMTNEWDNGTAQEKRNLLGNLLDAYNAVRDHLDANNGSSLKIYADIGHYFDKMPAPDPANGQVGWASEADRDQWFAEVSQVLDTVIIMAYGLRVSSIESTTEYERGALPNAELALNVKDIVSVGTGEDVWQDFDEFLQALVQVETNLNTDTTIHSYRYFKSFFNIPPPIIIPSMIIPPGIFNLLIGGQ